MKRRKKAHVLPRAYHILNQLEKKGFMKADKRVNIVLQNYPILHGVIGRFSSGMWTYGSTVFSGEDMFGKHEMIYYYDLHNPRPLINHMLQMFLTKNPNPSKGLKNTFTRLMHDHSLPWKGFERKRERVDG